MANATVTLELTKVGERCTVAMKIVSDDPSHNRDELFKFTNEDEAREGLNRALQWAEDQKKTGLVQSIHITGELTAVSAWTEWAKKDGAL